MPTMQQRMEELDRRQRENEKLGIAAATVKKFSEDQSSNLASMIAFWAFFSIFPLILVLVTILGYVLPSGTRSNVLEHVGSFFPLLNAKTVGGLTGSWWPLLVGLVTALWSGSAVVRVTQFAFNSVWEIPQKDRPGLVDKLKRTMLVLGTIGVGLVVSTVISSYVTGQNNGINLGWWGRLIGYVVAIALDVGLFVAAFRMLTSRDVTTRDVLPGALLAGGIFWILQEISSLIISRYLNGAQGTYGNFATVITILWWFYLQGQITLLGAQLNVVLKERLHPRSLFGGPETEADRRALAAYADEATHHERQEVETHFRDAAEAEHEERSPR